MVFRPDSASASATPPVMPPAGTEGYYTDGTPPSVPPTTVDAWYLHTLVEEIRNVVVGAGITPSKALVNQQLQAIKRICAANRGTIFTTATLTADNAGLVVVNAAAGNITLTLPAAAGAGGAPLKFVFMRTDTSANTVTVQDAGTDTDAPGGATALPVVAGSPLWIESDGVSVWDVVLGSTGGAVPVEVKTASYALVAADAGKVLLGDGTLTFTLPNSGVTAGYKVSIVNETGVVSINPNGNAIIDAQTTGNSVLTLPAPGDFVTLILDASLTYWRVLAGSAPVLGAAVASGVVAGGGAAYVNQTAARAIGTVYTNSGTRPLMVVILNSTAGSQSVSFAVAGVAIAGGGSGSTVTKSGTITAIVPAGATYELTGGGGISTWMEL